jgi:hypothetical protein
MLLTRGGVMDKKSVEMLLGWNRPSLVNWYLEKDLPVADDLEIMVNKTLRNSGKHPDSGMSGMWLWIGIGIFCFWLIYT